MHNDERSGSCEFWLLIVLPGKRRVLLAGRANAVRIAGNMKGEMDGKNN